MAQSWSSVEELGGKLQIPNPKLQRSPKLQSPISDVLTHQMRVGKAAHSPGGGVEVGFLELLWSLALEAWCFGFGHYGAAGAAALRLSHTIRILMSAGETPEMRAAWPTVPGRIWANFWRASIRRL